MSNEPDWRANPTAKKIASDENLTKFFVSNIAEEVDERVQKRESRRQRIWNIVFVILGLIGITGISTLVKTTVTTEIKAQLAGERALILAKFKEDIRQSLLEETKEIRESINKQSEAITKQTDYQQFAYQALSLKLEETGFHNTERDSIMFLLESIAAEPNLRKRPDFVVHLENIIDAFASADLHKQLSRIVSLFEYEMTESPGIAITMIQHYGQLLVGDILPTDRWPEENVEMFETFERACKAHKILAISLPYRLLVEFRLAGGVSSEQTLRQFENVDFFQSPTEKAEFYHGLMRHYEAELWQVNPTSQGSQIAIWTREFRDAHQNEIDQFLADEEVKAALFEKAIQLLSTGDPQRMLQGQYLFQELEIPEELLNSLLSN